MAARVGPAGPAFMGAVHFTGYRGIDNAEPVAVQALLEWIPGVRRRYGGPTEGNVLPVFADGQTHTVTVEKL